MESRKLGLSDQPLSLIVFFENPLELRNLRWTSTMAEQFEYYVRKMYAKYSQQWWWIPLALLLVSIASYGLLASKLGFYFDDWTAILALHAKIDLWKFYQSDRPFSAWTFLVFGPILGLSPLNWQIFTLVLRWATAWGVYWMLGYFWPNRKQVVFLIALVFAVHPVFTQQSISVAYSQHFITYALFVLSFGSMLAMISGRRPALMFSISIIATILHLMTMEYFWGLELLRPVALWWVIAREDKNTVAEKVKRLVKNWSPYLGALILIVFWRFVWVDFAGGDTNSLKLVAYIISEPVKGLIQLSQTILRDSVVLIASTWYKTLQPGLIDLASPSLMISWAVVLGTAVLVYIFGMKIHPEENSEQSAEHIWAKRALVFGIYAMLVGMLPGWLVFREISRGLFSDRIALPGMLGASIVMVSLAVLCTSRRKLLVVLISIFVGLAAGFHFRNANVYRWEWVEQRQFFWQLYWRAPALEENTAILADGALFNFTGEHPTGSALNVLYSTHKKTGQQPYWFFEIDDNFYKDISILLDGLPIHYSIRNLKFDGNGHNNLVVWYDFPGSCVWVLSEQDRLNPNIPVVTRAAIPVSNLSRINLSSEASTPPSQDIFGPEPDHTWCYYFQKASIAYYQQDWEGIVALGEIVEASDFEPNTDNKLEWYPFIDAYGRTGDWDQAENLTINAFKGDENVQGMFCEIWGNFITETPFTAKRDKTVSNVIDFLGCNSLP